MKKIYLGFFLFFNIWGAEENIDKVRQLISSSAWTDIRKCYQEKDNNLERYFTQFNEANIQLTSKLKEQPVSEIIKIKKTIQENEKYIDAFQYEIKQLFTEIRTKYTNIETKLGIIISCAEIQIHHKNAECINLSLAINMLENKIKNLTSKSHLFLRLNCHLNNLIKKYKEALKQKEENAKKISLYQIFNKSIWQEYTPKIHFLKQKIAEREKIRDDLQKKYKEELVKNLNPLLQQYMIEKL